MIGHPMSQQSVPITGNEKGVSSQSISEPDKVTTAQWGQNISEVNFNLICQQYNLWTTFIISKNIPDIIFFVHKSIGALKRQISRLKKV